MTQDQIRTIQSGIDNARTAIANHLTKMTKETLHEMIHEVGRLSGMYSMLGDRCPHAHIHKAVQDVHINFVSASKKLINHSNL